MKGDTLAALINDKAIRPHNPSRLQLLKTPSADGSAIVKCHGSFLCSHDDAIYAKKEAYFIEFGGLHDGIQTTTAAA
jgi:hypothetical protein